MYHPFTLPVLDVASPALLLIGPVAVLLMLFGIPLAEALVLLALKWGSFRRAFIDAFIVNLVTSLVGIGLFVTVVYEFTPGFYLLAFVLSVGIEGGILSWMKRHPARKTWLAALLANLVSYALIILLTNI